LQKYSCHRQTNLDVQMLPKACVICE
jgi:hypothetical protein